MNNTTSSPANTTGKGVLDVNLNTKIRITIYSLSFVLSVLGNGVVIILGIKKWKTSTSCRLLMTHLAITDLLFSFRIPGQIHLELTDYYWSEGVFLCRTFYGLSSSALLSSIYTMTVIAIERCRGVISTVSRPWLHRDAYRNMLIIWTLAILTYTPYMVALDVKNSSCSDTYPSKSLRCTYSLSLFFMKYICPLSVITVCYYIIIKKVRQRPIISGIARKKSGAEIRREQDNKRVVKIVIVVVMAFALLTLPASVWWIIYDCSGTSMNHGALQLIEVFATLVYLYAGVNPIIYGIMDRKFRTGIRTLIPCKGRVQPYDSSNFQ